MKREFRFYCNPEDKDETTPPVGEGDKDDKDDKVDGVPDTVNPDPR